MSDLTNIAIILVSVAAVIAVTVWVILARPEAQNAMRRPARVHGCWTNRPLHHPWIAMIIDTACGFDERMTHAKCTGCHRQRVESPLDQLQALDSRHSEDGIVK